MIFRIASTRFLENKKLLESTQQHAKAFIENNKGATEIVFKGINELLK